MGASTKYTWSDCNSQSKSPLSQLAEEGTLCCFCLQCSSELLVSSLELQCVLTI